MRVEPYLLLLCLSRPSLQTATLDADAELVTSTLNLDIKTPRPSPGEYETTDNFSHLPSTGAELLIHPPPAEGIITGIQSDVGATDTETINKKSTMEDTQSSPSLPVETPTQSLSKDPPSPPGEKLTRSHSKDPPSPGEEGAEQLKAGTEEAGISDQTVTVKSPEFPVVSYIYNSTLQFCLYVCMSVCHGLAQ